MDANLGRYEWGAQNSFHEKVEHYHCSPAYHPSDIICPGSDVEETPEETRKKRQRYEDMARRYEGGGRPMIQSARLRGPLSKESGWVNPWRYRPKLREDNSWWQPGSEDMLFTRENVMRRAAAHGLGYMSPAEALAWCKASAQAEVGPKIGEEWQGGILMSIEQDIQSGGEEKSSHDSANHSENGHADDFEHEHHPLQKEARLSMVKNHTTPSTDQHMNGSDKGVKRVVDAKWLKGSYISKRARWDGPALPSPTPVAGILGHRKERRRQLLLKHRTSSDVPAQQPTLSSSGFKSIRKEAPASSPVSKHDRGLSKCAPARVNNLETPSFIIEGRRSPGNTDNNFHRQIDDVDELQDELQEFSSAVSSQRSRKPSQNSSRNLEDHFMSDLEPDELVVITPYGGRNAKTLVTYDTRSPRKSSFSSSKLPTLPRNISVNRNDEYTEEDTFVTEVAPSSRDLEKFMFRKKRRTFIPARSELALNILEPDDDPQPTSSADAPTDIKADVGLRISPPSSTTSSTEQGDSIEDHIEDLKAAANLPSNTSNAIVDDSNALPSASHESDEDSTLNPTPKKSPLPQEVLQHLAIPPQRSSFIIRSSQITQPKDHQLFQKLPEDLEPAFKLPIEVTRSQNLNDISTQSFNTTPTCSRKTQTKAPTSSSVKRSPKNILQLPVSVAPISQDFPPQGTSLEEDDYFGTISRSNMPKDVDDITQTETYVEYELEDVEALAENRYGDEMHQIQIALSQGCQSTNSEHSTPREDREHHHQAGNIDVEKLEKENEPKFVVKIVEVTGTEKENDEIGNVEMEDALVEHVEVEAEDTRLSLEQPSVAEAPLPKSLSACSVNVDQRSHTPPKKVDERSSEIKEQNVDHVDHTPISPHNTDIDRDDIVASSQRNDVVQSPFAQEVFVMDGPRLDVNTKYEVVPASPVAEFETSWQDCGPQSPWASEAIERLPKFTVNSEANRTSIHISPQFQGQALIQEDGFTTPSFINQGQAGKYFERPQTPEDSGIKTFRDLTSPSPVRQPKQALTNERPTSTQLLVDAATKNPWSSSLKKPGSLRPKKRVSFSHFLAERRNSELQDSTDLRTRYTLPAPSLNNGLEDPRRPCYSPPPPSSEEDLFDGGIFRAGFVGATPKATPFSNHFMAMRKFTRILPESGSSPSKSSPNLSAQAEAFIAADREASPKRERTTLPQDSPTRHLKPRSTASDNIIWQDRQENFSRLNDRSPRSPQGKIQTFSTGMANFDMDAALGEMSEFLEDWSVDAELKKSKGESREREENGMRRRLFGLV